MLKSRFKYLRQKPMETANTKLEQGTDWTVTELQRLALDLNFESRLMIVWFYFLTYAEPKPAINQ